MEEQLTLQDDLNEWQLQIDRKTAETEGRLATALAQADTEHRARVRDSRTMRDAARDLAMETHRHESALIWLDRQRLAIAKQVAGGRF